MRFLSSIFIVTILVFFGSDHSLAAGEETEGKVGLDQPEAEAKVSAETPEEAVPSEVAVDHEEAVAEPEAVKEEESVEGWMERYRDTFKNQLDQSADWLDGVLGSDDFSNEQENTSGRVAVHLFWQNRQGFDVRGRFRVKVNLDNTSRRLNAFIGRDDPDDLIEDRYTASSRFASFYQGGVDEELLAGVGFRPDWSKSRRISIGAGVRLSSSPAPYVNINYRYRYLSDDQKLLISFYESVYYRTDEGVGSRTTIEPGYLVGEDWLVRWYNTFEFGETPQGVIWQSTLSIYQDLKRNRAIAYEFGAFEETGRPIPWVNYGASITYRQRMFHDWLFGEFTLGVQFPREEPGWDRRADPVIGAGVEFFFGGGD